MSLNVVHLYDGHEKVYRGRGSVPDVVWSLASQTVDRGHETVVIERQWDDLPVTAEHEGVTFHRIELRSGSDEPWNDVPYEMVRTPTGAARLLVDRTNFAIRGARLLRCLDPDVVHVHLPFAANVVATLSPELAARMVYTAHLGETESRVTDPAVSPDAYLARRVARIVALNPEMRNAFASRRVPEERLSVVPNGVDVERFDGVDEATKSRVREEHDLHGDPVVLFVGTVTPRKGVTELVEMARQIHTDHDGVQFVVVGRTDLEPEYTETVHRTIESAGLRDCVTLTGFVSEEELHAFYDLADIFVLPSYEEGSSVAVTEAMAADLPVVGSDIDGIAQQIDHGTHGLLAPPGDTETLAAHVSRLVEDPAERKSMRLALESRVRELSWERVTDRMIGVYEEVAE